MDRFVINHAIRSYGIERSALRPLPGGNYNTVYEFTRNGRQCVLRISPPSDEITPMSAQSVLHWMAHLAEGGVSVPRPVPTMRGRLVEVAAPRDEVYVLSAFEKVPGTLGMDLPRERWSDDLYRALGRTVGRMHAVGQTYERPEAVAPRPEWSAVGNCFNPLDTLHNAQHAIRVRRDEVLRRVAALPREGDGWGLVHADLHFGNVMVEVETGRITLLDFDDCCYGWFAMDMAMPLFDLLVLYGGDNREALGDRFIRAFTQGYVAEAPLNPFWIGRLPLFLKLVEIGVYTQVHRHHDTADTTSWVGRFMAGRRERIEGGVPYVDLDWAGIAAAL